MGQNSGSIFWFTGLSGSGKTTLATAVAKQLESVGIKTYLLDGDILRTGLCHDLHYSDQDRKENIRRAGEVAKLFMNEGYVVLCTFISPFASDRNMVRQNCPDGSFYEVYISTPLNKCEERDPKGLYKKAREGLISSFTGIDSPYEKPQQPELEINTYQYSISDAQQYVFGFIMESLSRHNTLPRNQLNKEKNRYV